MMSMFEIKFEAHDAYLSHGQISGQFQDQALGRKQQRLCFLHGSGQFERSGIAVWWRKRRTWVRQQAERAIDFIEQALAKAACKAIAWQGLQILDGMQAHIREQGNGLRRLVEQR